MTDAATPQVGTHTWQSDFVERNLADCSQYLDTVAGTDSLQKVAADAMALLDLQPGQ